MSRIVFVLLAVVGVGAAAFFWFASQDLTQSEINPAVSVVREQITESLRTKGADTAYMLFKEKYRNADFDVQHNVAHVFGKSLYEVSGVAGLRVCDDSFSFGCYHGFFTPAVASEGLDVVTELNTACLSSAQPSACRHGIGHGILEYLGHSRLTDALLACKKTDQPDPLAGCTSGVFMEYNVPLSVREDGTFALQTRPLLNPEEPYHPCTEVSPEFRVSCYHELPQWWMQVYMADFKTMGAQCADAPGESFISACFAGLGNIVASFAKYDPEKSAELCALMPSETWRRVCILNAAWSFETDARSRERAGSLCEYLPSSERQTCLR